MVFSIIIPIYNAEKNLIQCLDSICRQTDNDFEVILVDDGSKDSSGSICDEYVEKYNNFSVIHKENGGVSAARNTGMLAAKGDYCVFIDSDDFISEDYLHSIHSCISEEQPDIVVNSCHYIYTDSESKIYNYGIYKSLNVSATNMQDLLLDRKYPSALWMAAYKRKMILLHNLDDTIHFYEDLDFQLSLVGSVDLISVNNKPGYYYRMGSATHSFFNQKTVSCYKVNGRTPVP